MRIGIVTIPSAAETGPPVVEHVTAIARQVEALGFSWPVGHRRVRPRQANARSADPAGRAGEPDSRIELGTCVVQVPLRHPVEHAHRVQTLNVLSQGRFRFGVGSGSTRNDFDAVQADYDARFKTLTAIWR